MQQQLEWEREHFDHPRVGFAMAHSNAERLLRIHASPFFGFERLNILILWNPDPPVRMGVDKLRRIRVDATLAAISR